MRTKKPFLPPVVSPFIYFLSSWCLLLCLLASPARADLPSGWTGASIGWGTGSETFTGTGGGASPFDPTDTFTVIGNGSGVYLGLHDDDDRFAYTTMSGDMEVVARLVSFTNTTGGQAGLMIRQSNGTSEVNKAATWFWPNINGQGNAVAYAGFGPTVANTSNYYGNSAFIHKTTLVPPYWLKLVRVGQNFAAYWSLDGRDWALISNQSGGALLGTGNFNVGFFVSTYVEGPGTLSTAVFDNVYVGAPRLKYKTSWVGNTSQGIADGYASNKIFSLWVKADDGTCYANSDWDEGAQSVKAYKDGKVAFKIGDDSTHISNSGLFEGSVTGNASNLFLATLNHGYDVYRTDLNGHNPVKVSFATPIGVVGGMAASADRLLVSDVTNHNIRIVDLTKPTPTETGLVSAVIAHPGPMTFDGTNFWIIDCASPFPLTNYVAPVTGFTPKVKCVDPTGADLGRDITGISNPTALAKDPTTNYLYICDNGPNQNIRYYSGLNTTPTYAGSFGVTGGIWYSSSPGMIYEAGLGGWQRFYGPTGVGFDSSGNIYVACNGTNAMTTGGTDLRKFDSSRNLIWRQHGLLFCGVGDFDPLSDGQEIYTTEERFTMNYANTAPGSEWGYTAFTRSPFVANDVRNAGQTGVNGAVVRRLAGNNVFMFTTGQGDASPFWFYRFNNQATSFQGTQARPFGSLTWSTSPQLSHHLWFDTNGNGQVDAGEDSWIPATLGVLTAYDIDSQGDIWLAQNQGLGWTPSAISRIPCTGTQTIGTSPNTAVVPQYSLTNAQSFLCPAPLKALKNVKYDRANDVMYCLGQKSDGAWVVARYDNWLANPDDHPARYVTALPDWHTDITVLAPDNTYFCYQGIGFAGDKLFIADIYGPVRVYDANVGNLVITLNPGPEVSANMGWDDMVMGLNAFKRSNGEYLVTMEDAGYYARNLLYRWTPTADASAPGMATNLAATAQGHAILLSWTGPSGTVTSYNIYRGTTSGSLSLYQSNVKIASFVDINVTPGTLYYYKVAAVSTVGTGTQSNQASASALSTQVEFVKYDSTTKGTWNPSGGSQVYGVNGYNIAGQTENRPAYVTSVTRTNTSLRNSGVTTGDVRGLQLPAGGTRTAAYYDANNGNDPQTYDVVLNDTNWHQLALYMVAWDLPGTYHTVEVLDAAGTTVLDTRKLMDYSQGKWLIWNVRGSVKIRLTYGWGTPRVGGIFFDPVQTPAPTLGWWKLDDTGSGTTATDSSGAGNQAYKYGGTWNTGGQINGCMANAGTNATSYLAYTGFNSSSSSNLTYSLWFNTSASGVMLGMWNAALTAFAPVLYVGTDNKLHGAFYTGVSQNMVSTASVNDGIWHHAALTSNGNLQTLYLDGEVVGILSAPVPMVSNLWYYFVGSQGYVTGWPNTTGTQMYFNGKIDDIRLYNRVLPSSEIWKLKN